MGGGFELASSTLAPTRAPLDLVKTLAATPRFYTDERGFDPTDEYFFVSESVTALVLVVTLGALCVYGCVSYGRKNCWRCQRDVESARPGEEAASRGQRVALVVWLLVAVAAFAALTALAQRKIDRTMGTVERAIGDLADDFDDIDALADELVGYSDDLTRLSNEISCVDDDLYAQIQSSVGDFATEAADVKASTDDAGSEVGKLEDTVEGRQVWIDRALLLMIAFVALCFPPTACGCASASARILESCAARFSAFIFFVLSFVLAVEYGVLVKVADFCEKPDENFLRLADHKFNLNADDRDLLYYYVSCGGVNPLFAPLNASLADVYALNSTVAAARDAGACAPAAALTAIQDACGAALATVDAFQTAAACDALNPTYQRLAHNALCRGFLGSLYYLAVAHAVAAAALYVFLYACNFVAETLLLETERRELKCRVMGSPRHPRALETELPRRGPGA